MCVTVEGWKNPFLQNTSACFGMLCLMFLLFRTLVYVALRWGVTKNKK